MIDYSYRNKFTSSTEHLLDLYDMFPFHNHPFWKAVMKKELSPEEVLRGEGQHYLRTKAGQILRREAMEKCLAISTVMWESIIETYLEECTEDDGTPTHLDMIIRFLTENGITKENLIHYENTPGNIAAISLYKSISDRGVGCHIIGAGMVEYFYSHLSPLIFESYTKKYGFSEHSAETYKIHGTMDQTHAQRAFDVVQEALRIHGEKLIENSVRDAFVATSLHYDGMLQAATNTTSYWNGKS